MRAANCFPHPLSNRIKNEGSFFPHLPAERLERPLESPLLLVDFEMENVRDLIRTIDQNQIATDHAVRIIRRRREHHFEFPRTGLHFFLEARRQSSTNH